MSFEKYNQIAFMEEDKILRKNTSAEFTFELGEDEVKNRSHRLFFKGETSLFYFWKSEPACQGQYINIEDSLDSDNALSAPYCLNLSSDKRVVYKKTVYKKLQWPPRLLYLDLKVCSDIWQGGIFVKKRNLKISSDGFIKLKFEVRYERQGFGKHDVSYAPDDVYEINISEGSEDWKQHNVEIKLPQDKTASVCCILEAVGYSGELYLERPYLTSCNGYNILPDFAPCYPEHEQFCWVGVNLSKKEWPEFEITLNGQKIFEGEMFERCHKYSEFECNIPNGVIKTGENRLTLKLVSSYPNALPFLIKEVGCFVSKAEPVNIISVPYAADINKSVKILLKTTEPDLIVSLDCPSGVLTADEQHFAEAGLHVFTASLTQTGNDIKFSLNTKGTCVKSIIQRAVIKNGDEVYTGSGDYIYVNHESMEDMKEFLCWYLSNNIGNLFSIRPVYRWGGGRKINPETWEKLVSLLNELDIKYSHMVDGRDLPGCYCNPTPEMLAGKGFLGRQSHEVDGQYLYWGFRDFTNNKMREAVFDLWGRFVKEDETTSHLKFNFNEYLTDGDKKYYFRIPNAADDMEDAANNMIEKLKENKFNFTRHTGPTTAFKYFFQAGYDWVGAELMYGPMEIVMSALRGASYCYGNDSFGTHLAMQWSTTPHDSQYRYRRFNNALYVSYLQGATEINTEEGFWHIEEYYSFFDRNSTACKEHLKRQQDFYKYISSHSRTGKFYTSFAFLSGRYDGWRSFGSDMIWGIADFNSDMPEKSWELLREFYPLTPAENMLIYQHPCAEKEIGFHTGTPRGNADIVPIECELDKLLRYKTLSLAGYNKMLPEDADKLLGYVENGGTLIMGWPHLSVTTKRDEVLGGKINVIKHALADMICDSQVEFEDSSVNGAALKVCPLVITDDCDVVKTTDDNIPLVLKRKIGNGTLWFVNAAQYPAYEALEPIYREIICMCSDENNLSEDSFVKCGVDVQFSIYEQEDGARHIYILAVDWYNDPQKIRNAELVLYGKSFPVQLDFGAPLKVVVNNQAAAWFDSEHAEVLACTEEGVTVQGYGIQRINIIRNGGQRHIDIDFSQKSVVEIKYDDLNW